MCEAVGPPDPVLIRWLRDGLPDSDYHNSPSSFTVSGETSTTHFGLNHLFSFHAREVTVNF